MFIFGDYMTIDEYKKQGWTPNMRAIYQGGIYDIGACNFVEFLVGLDNGSDDDYLWVRCENIELVK